MRRRPLHVLDERRRIARQLRRPLNRSVGVGILFAHADACGALGRAEDAGEHPHALYHLRHAIDHLERAHRYLVSPSGTAIVNPWEPEPVEVWPDTPGRVRVPLSGPQDDAGGAL